MGRWIGVFVVVGILAAACAGGSTPSTSAPTSPTSGVVESTSTLPSVTPTTGIGTAWPDVEVLVTNNDGVFLVDTEGNLSQLVKGRVAYAVDDTLGGLLFQVERGRNWELSFGGPSERSQETVVWWVPSGSSAAQALLVPTPGAGHWLSLHDAYRAGKSFSVLYTRSEGSVPFDDAWEKLRIFDVEVGEAREVATVGGWESDFVDVSVNGGLIAGTSDCWVNGIECILLTMDGEYLTLHGPPTGHDCREQGAGRCGYSCVVSADGSQLAYLETPTFDAEPAGETNLILRELASGMEVERRIIGFDVPLNWSLDVNGGLALVNHRTGYPNLNEVFAGALLIDLSDGSQWELPEWGRSRFATSPLDIRGPVVPPTPAAIQLRPDGLGVVDFGDTVQEAAEALAGVLGETVAAPEGILQWSTPALAVVSNRLDVSTGASTEIPLVTNWYYWGPGGDPGVPLETADGITIGSTVAALRNAYGEDLWVCSQFSEQGDDVSWGWMTTAGVPPSWDRWWRDGSFGLSGWFDRNPEDPDAQVVGMTAGWRLADHTCIPLE